MAEPRALTRIQTRNRERILDAALDVFSAHGFRGATLDQIATAADLSKPNLLYYFPSKAEIHVALLAGLMDTWLDPLREMDPDGDPVEELLAYVDRKLEMSRLFPRESKLFAGEIVQGAPRMLEALRGDLKPLVDEKAKLLEAWMAQGKIARMHPHHLIFSIWSLTQHYADFDVQIGTVLGDDGDVFEEARSYLRMLFRKLLAP